MRSRLLKKLIYAEWVPVNLKKDDFVQVLTDAMSYNSNLQINYKGSGWRSIQPYGWNASKDGNILLMCYKDTGEIRSYRIDRIYDLLVDNELLKNIDDNNDLHFEDFQIPMLPNIDKIIADTEAEVGEERPFDDALKAIETNEVPEEYQYTPERKADDEIDTEEFDDAIIEGLDEVNDFDLSTSAQEKREELEEEDNIDLEDININNEDNSNDNDSNDNSEEDSTEDDSNDNNSKEEIEEGK